MKNRLFAAIVLTLLAIYIFGGSVMANNTLENLTGTWVEVDPEGKGSQWAHTHSSSGIYRVIINGDKLILKEGENILVDTTFRVDTTYRRNIMDIRLFNIQMRQNWQDYSGDNQYEGSFGAFDLSEYFVNAKLKKLKEHLHEQKSSISKDSSISQRVCVVSASTEKA